MPVQKGDYLERMTTDQNELRLYMHKREWWIARTAKGDKSDKVTITGWSTRSASYTEVKGEREDVLDHVAYLIDRDGPPQMMYEHLSLMVYKITVANGETVASLSQSLYAGD